jgi:NAD+ synthase
MKNRELSSNVLNIDTQKEASRLEEWIRDIVFNVLRKKGVVIGLSGGVDSSVCAAICVNSLGKERVFGLFTPEKECKEETNDLGKVIAEHLDIDVLKEDITSTLKSAGCYERRNDGIRMTVPEFEDTWGSKVALPSILESDRLNISNIIVRSPSGREIVKRMKKSSYLQVVAASNFKQRTRKMIEYYHAERLNYAVVGTPNKLEYELGFFVKYGDGAADLKPIAHLYKTQVYQLGRHYGLPEEILERPPTTDTYSLPQSQEEFYFSLPYDKMDLALYSFNNGYEESELARALSVDESIAGRVYKDIENKKRVAKFLQSPPLLMMEEGNHI